MIKWAADPGEREIPVIGMSSEGSNVRTEKEKDLAEYSECHNLKNANCFQ